MPKKTDYAEFRVFANDEILTVPNNSQLSNPISLSGTFVAGFITPASLTSNKLSFQASIDGTNFFDLYDGVGAGALKEIGIGTNRAISLRDNLHNMDFPFVRIKTSSAEGAERKFQLVLSIK